MTWAIHAPAQPSLPVVGTENRFPVRRIFCVGQNYADHALEMGSNPDRDPPFFFSKPADALVMDGEIIPYPQGTKNLHHEAELVIAIGKEGVEIPAHAAQSYVWGYAVGNDLTRRDVQADAKSAGRPWDMAKGFDKSAPCGPVHPIAKTGPLGAARITATVNGVVRQESDISNMIWPVTDVISHLSGLVTLQAGDLIYTGTPEGVGPLVPGDACVIEIEGLGKLTTHISLS